MTGGGGTNTVQFSSANDLVSFDGVFGAGSIMGGSVTTPWSSLAALRSTPLRLSNLGPVMTH